MCQRALTQKQTLGGGRFEVVAHSSFSIFVSLRTAASLVTPSSPMPLIARLQRRGGAKVVRQQECQGALTQKQTLGRWFECPSSLLERLQGQIALEALCERRSSLGSELVVTETAGVGSRGGR